MKFEIKKATKKAARLRMALVGPSGSGKTFTALGVATGLGKRVVVIDTERGSASKYAGRFEFDVLELDTFEPRTYCEAIRACVEAGAEVIVIDSLSHAWIGKGGALEQVDRAAKRQGGNSFGAWRDVTPMHNELVDTILRADAHVIVTMRAKTDYVQEKDERSGRTVVRKVGLAPVQRDGLEYEFDVVADVNHDHEAIITKSRCPELADAVLSKPGADLAEKLCTWLTDGAEPAQGQGDDVRNAEVEPAAGREMPPALAAFYEDLAGIELPGESVAVWMKHRANLATLLSAYRETAWKALCARTEDVGKMKNARVWLKKAIAEEDARRGVVSAEVRAEPAPSKRILDDVRESAAARHTVRELADLWRSARAEIKAAKADAAGWKILADRALALGLVPGEVKAEIARLDAPPPPDGTDGPSGPRSAANDTATAEGSAAPASGTHGPVALAAPDAWRLSAAGITAHVAEIGNIPRLANSARRNLGAIAEPLRTHAVHVYAGRLQRLSVDGDGSTLAWEACVERAETWLREGPKDAAPQPQRRKDKAA